MDVRNLLGDRAIEDVDMEEEEGEEAEAAVEASRSRFDPCTCQEISEAGCDGTWSPIHPYAETIWSEG
jgi:hypothetical protein